MNRFKPHIALLICNIVWAMDYPFYNIVLPRYVHPMAMVSGSLIATALFSLVPLLWQKAEKVEKADVRKLIGAALLIGVLRKVFIMYGLSMTSPIDGSIIDTIVPLLVLLLSVLLAAMVGFGTGMYDGFFGPGAGTFMTLLFNSVLGLGIIKACGTTKVVNLASNVGALITYGMNGNVLVGIGIKCTIFAILGSWVGSGLALKNGAKIVRPIMIVAMLLLLLKIASDMFLG